MVNNCVAISNNLWSQMLKYMWLWTDRNAVLTYWMWMRYELVLWHGECCCCLFVLFVVLVSLFLWWCGLVHQRCVCRGAARRWEAAQRVSLFLTAPRQQATPTGSEGRSRLIVAPPTRTLWFIHLDAVSCWESSQQSFNEFSVNICHLNMDFQCNISVKSSAVNCSRGKIVVQLT